MDKYPKNSLTSLEVEKAALGGLLRHPDVFYEIEQFIDESVFTDADRVHAAIYSTIKRLLTSGREVAVTPHIVAQEIVALGLKFKGDLDIYEYLVSISYANPNKESVKESFRLLLKLKVCRDLYYQADAVKHYIVTHTNEPIADIVKKVDELNNEKIQAFLASNTGVVDIFETAADVIFDIAENPPDESKFLLGPFPTINRLFGSLHRPGNITCCASRSGVGKTGLSIFYNIYVCEKHGIPLLHMDNGEMTDRELLLRAVCMMTAGVVSVHSLETGAWKGNSELEPLVKAALARAKKIKFYYKNVAGMSPLDTISFVRRFYLNKIGRDNPLIINYDYFKPFDNQMYDRPDWRELGVFVQQVKSFITNEIQLPWWANIQLNRAGITTNMTSDKVTINEGAISLSDMITHQATFCFILRPKMSDELAKFGSQFGNLILQPVKHRHLGKDWKDAITPVELDSGRFVKNYINLSGTSFYYKDCGDLKTAVERLKAGVTLAKDDDDHHATNDDDEPVLL